jgi:hypothetical protein
MTPAAVSDRTEYRPFAAFALIWAISSLIHQLAFTFWTESWEGWVLVLAAIAVIYRPDCVLRFALHAVASLLQLWDKLPFVPNHILYEGMLHLIMLLGAIGFFFRGTGRHELSRAGGAWKSRLLLLANRRARQGRLLPAAGLPAGLPPRGRDDALPPRRPLARPLSYADRRRR